jgi:hypothetical protein
MREIPDEIRRDDSAEVEEMEQSANITELAKALAKLQGELKTVSRDKTNPYFNSKYADLSAIWDACRKPLADNGLSLVQTTDRAGEDIVLETLLLHETGEWIKGKLPINPARDEPQAIGSAISYARRYAMSAMLGIVSDEDDDAEAGAAHQTRKNNSYSTGIQQTAEKKEADSHSGKISAEQISLLDSYKKAGYNIAEKVQKYGWKAAKMNDFTYDQARRLINEFQAPPH